MPLLQTKRQPLARCAFLLFVVPSSPFLLGPPIPSLTHQRHVSYNHRVKRHRYNGRHQPFTPTPSRRVHQSLSSLALGVSLPTSLIGVENVYLLLLALQFACQPVLTKKFAPQNIIRSTYVLAQDASRLALGLALLCATGSFTTATRHWTLSGAWLAAGFPASLYAVQNYCSLMAYQNLSPITYNVLNQTKTLSAAVWCYILMRKLQSPLQIVALLLLLSAALVMEKVVPLPRFQRQKETETTLEDETSSTTQDLVATVVSIENKSTTTHWKRGVLPVLAASLISGLAGAYTQKTLQQPLLHLQAHTNSLLLSTEMAFFSALFLVASLVAGSPDRSRIDKEGWTVGWTRKTWIPIATNAAGGVLVGLVTKFSGSVRKGFALILGMFLSGLLQNYLQAKRGDDASASASGSGTGKVTVEQWVGGFLAAVSLWMHTKFPI